MCWNWGRGQVKEGRVGFWVDVKHSSLTAYLSNVHWIHWQALCPPDLRAFTLAWERRAKPLWEGIVLKLNYIWCHFCSALLWTDPCSPFTLCTQLEAISVPELFESDTCSLFNQAFKSEAQTSGACTLMFLRFVWVVCELSVRVIFLLRNKA